MTRQEAIAELSVLHERLSNLKDCEDGCYSWEDGQYVEAIDMAIEALSAEAVQGECRTCKRSSDYLWKNGEEGTRCPIEEHYALPKDGYCHLYEPYKGGDKE